MSDIQQNLDELDDILASAGAAAVEKFVPQEEELQERLPYLKFTQRNSGQGYPGLNNIPNSMISLRTEIKDGKWEGFFFAENEIKWWLVDYLYEYTGTKGKDKPQQIGGRTMMPFKDDDGQPKQGGDLQPECRSHDGKAPNERFIGKQIRFPTAAKYGYLAGKLHIIGTKDVVENGNGTLSFTMIENPEHICQECPFAQFTRTEGSKSVKPLCSLRWSAVIYLPPQTAYKLTNNVKKPLAEIEYPGGMCILQGNPNAVQMAMEGRLAKESGAPADGVNEFPDLWRFTKDHGTVQTQVKHAQIKPHMKPAIIDSGEEGATLEVPAYKWARRGTPEFVGFEAALPEMNYLSMRIFQNNWDNPSNAPQWTLHTDPVEAVHYAMFLREKKRYHDENMRGYLLRPENMQEVQRKLVAPLQPAAFLPKNAGGGDIVEGSIEELSDM